jgi:hypothetical protein
MNWKGDKSWSDRFIPRIRQIVGPWLLVPSTLEVDRHEAADLVVLRGRDMTLACRVRRAGFLPAYRNQFTIRCHRDSGAKTELEKITEGWGDWMFYGHSNAAESDFDLWWLLDLSAWRAHLIRDKGSIKRGKVSNGDGTSFAWFDISSFTGDPELVISASFIERGLN